MRTEFTAQPYSQKVSFKALKNIDKTAIRLAGEAINQAKPTLVKQAADVDVEIIGKRGIFSDIKSLILFVTKIGEETGEWFSLSIDPKKYMPTHTRYKTVKEFTAQDIIEGVEDAKNRMKKLNMQLPKPSFPVDAVLLKPLIKKFQNLNK